MEKKELDPNKKQEEKDVEGQDLSRADLPRRDGVEDYEERQRNGDGQSRLGVKGTVEGNCRDRRESDGDGEEGEKEE